MQTNRSNAGALIAGIVLIACGLLTLAGQFFQFMNWGFLWPFIVIGIGALFFLAMFMGGRQSAAFAIPGSIIGGIGLILLLHNTTGRWESMSYFWALIIVSVGVGIYLMGWYGRDASQRRSGWGVMKVGFVLFIIFGAFFEMIFGSFNGLIFPILLVVLGLYLLLSSSGLIRGRKNEESSDPPLPPAS